jgi:hypothetical protein
VIQYAPGVPSALDTDTINISYNDGVGAQNVTRDVQGVATTPANITISDSDPYDYGTVATGAVVTHAFTLTNTGGFTASALSEIGLAAPFAFAGGSFPGTGGTCAVTMAPAAACTVVVAFSPVSTGVAGDTTTALRLSVHRAKFKVRALHRRSSPFRKPILMITAISPSVRRRTSRSR